MIKTSQISLHTVIVVVVLLFSSSCISYHVSPDRSLQGERAYKVIDTMIRKDHFAWHTSQVGADDQYFSLIRTTCSIPISGPDYTGREYFGKIITYRYADIEDVSVRASFGALLFCGIIDPTSSSCVRIKFKDGTTSDIGAFRFPMRLIPLWLISPEWCRAHEGAKAFQSIVDDLRRGSASEEPK